ncbi:right-handed parallel beta-helix repeat-containing protein [Sphingobium phenoxybenzoativorans]|uniref:Right-handed parallel beta-helix repeat-containing protein n=1 Tax=Sphingobium phenoxybenzoativorans TaxID=1592790 RepID=A0A975Q0I7_9SPHN|nr:right-handed parallel beta-helix repeat-containing protein [Sphingobium phenoxybenzoativorans]QUT04362.1 right-handed parallel beta-helix repeat-containing protein [Sphingobium phenoxybenzoativorans]
MKSILTWFLIAIGTLMSSAHAQAVKPFSPKLIKKLADFGAVGDGISDDTNALKLALSQSGRYCLDGQNRTYRVSGTLRVTNSLCLSRATLSQSLEPFDPSPYISGKCPATGNPFIIVDCGDANVPDDKFGILRQSLALRTLFIKPAKPGDVLAVNLDRVKIDRGPYPDAGSRQDAAGIWLDGAERVDFRNVEISGGGKGYGLLLIRSRNITLVGLHIHDIVWTPYKGDTALKLAEVEAAGWNAVPIREFRTAGSAEGATQNKFYGVRVQEQVTCAFLADVTHVVIRNARISRCMARFDVGDVPWQADGLDIGRSSSDILVTGKTSIDSTWEGVDVVASGEGVDGLALDGILVSNSFSYGLKLGYKLSRAKVRAPVISGAGLAGILVYGPVRDVSIANADIRGMGSLTVAGARLQPWASQTRVGVCLDEGSRGTEAEGRTPTQISISNVTVGGAIKSGSYEYGFSNHGATNVRVSHVQASDFRREALRGF